MRHFNIPEQWESLMCGIHVGLGETLPGCKLGDSTEIVVNRRWICEFRINEKDWCIRGSGERLWRIINRVNIIHRACLMISRR